MTKEELIALGVAEDKAQELADKLAAEYVAKAQHEELTKELKAVKASLKERDNQLEELKTAGGDNAELKQQIETLQQQNADQEKAHKAEMAQLKLDNAVEAALTAAGAKNNRAVKALLDMSKVKLGEDGKLSGWDEQLAALQKSDSYLFTAGQQNNLRGFQPGAASDGNPAGGVDTSKMNYEELCAYMEQNPGVELK